MTRFTTNRIRSQSRRLLARATSTFGACALAFAWASTSAGAAPDVGVAAPTFEAASLAGAPVGLAAFRGKVVLVNYWATWCVPCRKEMPVLDSLYRKYHDRGLELISVSVDFPRDLDKVREASASFAFPVVHRPAATADGFGKPSAVPITYLIGRDGVIRDRYIAVYEQELESAIVALLAP